MSENISALQSKQNIAESSTNSRGDNRIELKCSNDIKEKIQINIIGKNNIVIVEEAVIVSECLLILIVDDNCLVHIGKGCTFEETCISIADRGNRVIIGEDSMFARRTTVLASDFHTIADLKTGKRKNISKEVIIDNHVWIGFGATILKNTHIMSNSIIGAHSVVHGMVLPNSIFIGTNFRRGHEVTWDRDREAGIMPCKCINLWQRVIFNWRKIYYRKSKDINLVYSIENDIKKCMNKIYGWAFLENFDARKSYIYLYISFKKKLKKMVFPLNIMERADVSNAYGDDRYRCCGFNMYMPAYVIVNQKNLKKVELIIINRKTWNSVVLI